MSEEQRLKSSLFKKKFVIEEDKRSLRSGARNSINNSSTQKKSSSIPHENLLLTQAPSNSIIHQMFDTSKSPEDAARINQTERESIQRKLEKREEMYRLLKRNFG